MEALQGGHQVAQKSMATSRRPGSGRGVSHFSTLNAGTFFPRMSLPPETGARNSGHLTSSAGLASGAPAGAGRSRPWTLSSTSSAMRSGTLALSPASVRPANRTTPALSMTMLTGLLQTPSASHHAPSASIATRHGGFPLSESSPRPAWSGVCSPSSTAPSGSAFFAFSRAARALALPPTDWITVTLPRHASRSMASPPSQASVSVGFGTRNPTLALSASRSSLSSFS